MDNLDPVILHPPLQAEPVKTRPQHDVTLSVVIPAHNPGNRLGMAVRALLNQEHPPLEIIIVDDGSDSPVAAVDHPLVKVHRLKERSGAGAARHAGSVLAKGDVLGFLDADCVPPPNWTSLILDEFRKDPGLGVLGGRYTQAAGDGFFHQLGRLEDEYDGAIWSQQQPNAPGGNTAVRRTVWERARSRREEIFFRRRAAADDTIVLADLRNVAPIRFAPELVVEHGRPTLGGYVRRHLNRGFGGTLLILRHLAPGELKNNFSLYGGTRVVIGTALPWLVPVAALASWLDVRLAVPAAVVILLALLGSVVTTRPYFAAAHARDAARPAKARRTHLRRLGLRAMLSLRFACWGVGAAQAAWWHVRERIGLYYGLGASVLHFWVPRRVSRLFLFVTSRCNARCSFCFNLDNVENWNARRPAELTLDELQTIASKCHRLPFLNLSGGEPFMRRDLPQVVEAFYRLARTQWVTIPTNASLTRRTIDMVREILVRCPRLLLTIQVSLDSLGSDHDRSRKIPGGFKAMAETLRELAVLRAKYPRLRIQLSTVLGDFNIHRLEEISEYCKSHFQYDQQMFGLIRDKNKLINHDNDDILARYLTFLAESEKQEWKSQRQSVWARIVRAFQAVTYADYVRIKRTDAYIRPCYAGRKFATLYDDGQVFACEILASADHGNVRSHGYDLNALLRRAEAREFQRDEIVGKQCTCEWTCAIPSNILYDISSYWRVAKALVHPDKVVGADIG